MTAELVINLNFRLILSPFLSPSRSAKRFLSSVDLRAAVKGRRLISGHLNDLIKHTNECQMEHSEATLCAPDGC